MAEAQLRIKPTIVGSVRASIASDERQLRALDRTQRTVLGRGAREASKLERAYRGVGQATAVAHRGVQSIASSVFNLRNMVVGIAAGGVGKSLLENTIGRADDVARAKALLGSVLKDQGKVNEAIAQARNLTKEVSSLDFASALQGIEKTAVLAEGNIGRAKEMVKIAKALEAIDPAQGFEGALFALKELESGDAMSLRERFGFRLPTQAEAKKLAKKAGKTLQQYYFDELLGMIDKRHGTPGERLSGVNTLLEIDRNSLRGQFRMVKTEVADVFETIGTEAGSVASKAIPELVAEIQKLKADPKFKEDVRYLAENLALMTKDAIEIAKQVPKAIRSVSDFVKEHPDLVKIGAGLVATDVATGGLVRKGIGAGVSAGYGALGSLIGRKGGKAGALAGAAGSAGAIPVYVVNMGDGFGAPDGPSKKRGPKGKGGAGAALTGVEIASTAAPLMPAVVAGAGILAGGAVGLLGGYQAFTGTSNALAGGRDTRAKEAAAAERAKAGLIQREKANSVARRHSELSRSVTGDFGGRLNDIMIAPQSRRMGMAQDALGDLSARLKAAGPSGRKQLLASLEGQIGNLGLDASYKNGRAQFAVDAEMKKQVRALEKKKSLSMKEVEELKSLRTKVARGEEVARQLNGVRVDKIEIHLGAGATQQDARMAADEMKRGLQELAREEARIGPR